ncbi:MAG: glycosyltransferase [Polyangia bacterium]
MSLLFSIITPCLNAAPWLDETIRSVLDQTAVRDGKVNVEHIVVDGGSRDNTVSILRRFQEQHPGVFAFSSEPDRGMYDALAKGLRRARGDIVAYLNAGDYYHPTCFDVVRTIFEQNPTVAWLTGYGVAYNEFGQVFEVGLPYLYRRRLVRLGAYGVDLPFIQQESAFWRAELLSEVDYDKLASFRLAGDFYLWHQFAGKTDLRIVQALLGGFRCQPGQLSADLAAYRDEMKGIVTSKPTARDRAEILLDHVLFRAPDWLKPRMNPDIFRFSREHGWTARPGSA